MTQPVKSPTDRAAISIYRYTVPFFDTDAMGIVHHANYVRYLELAAWPSPLSVSYHWPFVDSPFANWPHLLLLATLFSAVLWAVQKRGWLALPGVVFFVVLAPTSSFIPILTEVVAERRMYLPLAALIAAALCIGFWGLSRIAQRAGASPRLAASVGAVLVAALAAMAGLVLLP